MKVAILSPWLTLPAPLLLRRISPEPFARSAPIQKSDPLERLKRDTTAPLLDEIRPRTKALQAEEQAAASKESTGCQQTSLEGEDLKLLIRDHFGQRSGHSDWDPRADLNDDGIVDIRDKRHLRDTQLKELTKQQFGCRSGDPNFDQRADLNGDGLVDIRDKAVLRNRLLKGIRA